jgi:hypothetical protein
MVLRPRRFALRHLDSSDTERPDIGLEIVALLLGDDLWRHPEGRADNRVSLGELLIELNGDAKIAELHIASSGQ